MDLTPLRRVYWIPPVMQVRQNRTSRGIIIDKGFVFEGIIRTVRILIEICSYKNKFMIFEPMELLVEYITETQPIEMCELLTYPNERVREMAVGMSNERSRLQSVVRQ